MMESESASLGRAAQEWARAFVQSSPLMLAETLNFAYPVEPDSDDIGPWMALNDMGVTAAQIVREPRFRVKPQKAQRDADLGRDTMHLAPLWRWPLQGAETGELALLLPVCDGDKRASRTMSIFEMGVDAFAESVTDLIAIPLNGQRARSMTGYTVAIGDFRADRKGRLAVHLNARAWIDGYLSIIRTITADTFGDAIPSAHMPFPEPMVPLLLEPNALEWRIWHPACVIPTAATAVVCPDSAALAEWIDKKMREKQRIRGYPTIYGPKKEKAA
jgi:hypothetical protein